VNILILEDEYHTAVHLKEVIEGAGDYTVTETIESVGEAVAFLSEQQETIDLAFFDIHLADGHSFEIFKHVDVRVPIIFCTAYDAYTLDAIKNNGIDYILKPFKELDITQALTKYHNLVNRLSKSIAPISITQSDKPVYQDVFITQYRQRSLVKRVSEIALFAIEHETVFLYTFSGQKFPLYKKLEDIASVLDPRIYFRISRQMIIRKEAVVSLELLNNRKLKLQLPFVIGNEVIVSRLKVTEFKGWLVND
jgi:DNA-binding LytR/AlgR family response regulator